MIRHRYGGLADDVAGNEIKIPGRPGGRP